MSRRCKGSGCGACAEAKNSTARRLGSRPPPAAAAAVQRDLASSAAAAYASGGGRCQAPPSPAQALGGSHAPQRTFPARRSSVARRLSPPPTQLETEVAEEYEAEGQRCEAARNHKEDGCAERRGRPFWNGAVWRGQHKRARHALQPRCRACTPAVWPCLSHHLAAPQFVKVCLPRRVCGGHTHWLWLPTR